MNFQQALTLLYEGRSVRRGDWTDRNLHICRIEDWSECDPKFGSRLLEKHEPCLLYVFSAICPDGSYENLSHCQYAVFKDKDVLATDWEVF